MIFNNALIFSFTNTEKDKRVNFQTKKLTLIVNNLVAYPYF